MDVSTTPRRTLAEFLEWEERQESRFEFNRREPEEMTGGIERHAPIKLSPVRGAARPAAGYVLPAIRQRHEGRNRERLPISRRLDCPGPLRPDNVVRRDPRVIFEVLSDSTSKKDRTVKNTEDRAMGSVMRYVMLEQDCALATVFERIGDDWVGHLLVGRDATLAMPEVGVSLSLGAIYQGVAIEDDASSVVDPA